MKFITLCADDFSFSPGISEAIIHLIDRNRLSATNCMVNTNDWNEHASALKPFIHKIDIGLHFALTNVKPACTRLYQHPNIIKTAYLRRISQVDIENELEQQIERFEKVMGCLPDFIDGHQHIHQLPVIRDALLSVYEKTFPEKNCYIRVPIMKPATLKSRVITYTGSIALKKALIKKNIPFNTSFSGIYNFSKAEQYPQYCRHFLKNIQSGGLMMCHPGLSKNNDGGMASARQKEFNYFNSDRFLKDCEDYSVKLKRMAGAS